MRRCVLVVIAVLAAGCGGETEKPQAAAATPSPSATPTASAVVIPAPPEERAKAELQNHLFGVTQDKRRYCVPANLIPDPAIAIQKCDYIDGPQGTYLLFKTRGELLTYFSREAKRGRAIRDTECNASTWDRKGKEQGRLAMRRDGALKLLMWTDDSERVFAVIRTKRASPRLLCELWFENA